MIFGYSVKLLDYINFISPEKGEHYLQVQNELGKIVAVKTVDIDNLVYHSSFGFSNQSLYFVTVQNSADTVTKDRTKKFILFYFFSYLVHVILTQ